MIAGRIYSSFKKEGIGNIVLRSMKRGDLDSLLPFAHELYEERNRNRNLGIISLDRWMSRKDESEFLEHVLSGLEKDEVVSVAAFREKKLVGNRDIYRRKMKDVHHTGVLGIVILEGYRGVGLGEAMMRTALAQAAKVGIWLVELQVFANNRRAMALYEKLGFKAVGMVPNKIMRRGKAIDEVVMYADLRPTDKSTTRRRTRR